MSSNPTLTVTLVVTEITAGLSKSLFPHAEDPGKARIYKAIISFLLLIELAANITIGIWTLIRFAKCGPLTIVAFAFAMIADVSMWLAEAWIAFSVLEMQIPRGFMRGFISHPASWVSFFVLLITVLPFGAGAIRSFFLQPLRECSKIAGTEAGFVLGFSCICIFNILGWVLFGRKTVLLACSLMSVLTFTTVLGIWTSAQPERQIIVHGLLVIVPPTVTLLLNWAKLTFLTKDSDEDMQTLAYTINSGKENLRDFWSWLREGFA